MAVEVAREGATTLSRLSNGAVNALSVGNGFVGQVEAVSKPVIMAIHCAALGSGLELAMPDITASLRPVRVSGSPKLRWAFSPERGRRKGCRARIVGGRHHMPAGRGRYDFAPWLRLRPVTRRAGTARHGDLHP